MELFVYGTLTEPDRVDELLREYALLDGATLRGLQVVEGCYPTLAPGGRAAGRLLRTPEIDRLDAYEGVDRGLYVRVRVPSDHPAADAVAVYVGRPDRLGLADRIAWPDDGTFRERVEQYVADNDVRVVASEGEAAGTADAT